MNNKRFAKLRQAIKACGKVEDAAQALGRTGEYVYKRLRGVKPWDLSDVYILLRYLEIPPEQIYEFFPENGIESGKTGVKMVSINSYQLKLLNAYDECRYKDAVDTLLGIGGKVMP